MLKTLVWFFLTSAAVAQSAGGGTYSGGIHLSANAHSVALNWSVSSNAIGYNLYRATVSGGPYTKINSAPDSDVNYVDNTVVSGTTYYYAVTSLGGNSYESGKSSEATATVPNP